MFEICKVVYQQVMWVGGPVIVTQRIFLGICQWKNFENPSTFAEVMIKSQVTWFLWDTAYMYMSSRALFRDSTGTINFHFVVLLE